MASIRNTVMRVKHSPGLFLVAIVFALALVGCGYPRAERQRAEGENWQGYGQPGLDKITIYVGGDVREPGRYFVKPGISLAEIPQLVDGWEPCKICKMVPRSVEHRRGSGAGQQSKRYKFVAMSREELKKVGLEDGDQLIYMTAHW